jgi:hypothetical protein
MNLINWWLERNLWVKLLCAVPFLVLGTPAFIHMTEKGEVDFLGALPAFVGVIIILAALCAGRDNDWV